jgi:hypothetical protein
MTRRSLFGAAVLAATALLMLPQASHSQNAQPNQGAAQQTPPAKPEPAQARSLKDNLVGTWRLLIADEVEADGTQKPLFGPNPIGTLILTANGRYSLQIVRYNRRKFAANDPTKGTAEEDKTALSGLLSHFGTYTIDEPGKKIIFRVEGSAYPNWDETRQERAITGFNPKDVLTFTGPAINASGRPMTMAWKWVP